jgi:outer membrane lipase/esterase
MKKNNILNPSFKKTRPFKKTQVQNTPMQKVTLRAGKRATFAALTGFGLGLSSLSLAGPYNDIYVFGDSLSDSGYLGLRFTNRVGPNYNDANAPFANIAIEHTADDLGLSLTSVRFGGNNYAVGGNQSGQIFSSVIAPGSYATSVTTGTGDVVPAPSFFGQVGRGLANPEALYYINGGGNDLLNNNVAGIAATGSNLIGAAEALTTRGARTIVVSNIPDLSASPAITIQGSAVQATMLQTVSQVNSDILNRANISVENGTANVLIVDSFGISQEIVNNPERFGFNTYGGQLAALCFNTNEAVCAANPVDGQINSANPNPDLFAFNDGVHPTARTQGILGDYYSSILMAPVEISTLPRLSMDGVRQQWDSAKHLQPAALKQWQAFAHVQDGERERQQSLANETTFNHEYTHLVLGTQYRPSDTVGLSFSLGKNDGDQQFGSGTLIEQDSVLVSIDTIFQYQRLKFESELTQADTDYDTILRRFELGPANYQQQGRTEGTTRGLRLELAYAALLTSSVSITPLMGFDYLRADLDGYREAGTDSTALNFADQTQYSRRFKLGIASAWHCPEHMMTLSGQLNWITEKANAPQAVRLGLNTQTGNQAELRGYTPENQGLELDLSVGYKLSKRASVAAGVSLEDWESLSTQIDLSAQLAL